MSNEEGDGKMRNSPEMMAGPRLVPYISPKTFRTTSPDRDRFAIPITVLQKAITPM